MADKSFLTAFTATMVKEGGYSFDHLDPGGETYLGISRVYWPDWEGWLIIDRALAAGKKLLSVPELPPMVRNFYRIHYWQRLRGSDMAAISEPVVLELFDTAVNLGVHTAAKYLQQALNLLNLNQRAYSDLVEDGLIGPATLTTLQLYMDRRPPLRSTKQRMLLNVLNTLQGMHYITQMRRHPEKERFRGWFMRI